MSHVSTADLRKQLEQGDRSYLEVLNEESMSVELARYPNPAAKTPHREDELYYVISGSGMASVGDETYAVDQGDVIYVERGVEHDFFDIDEKLLALIVFAGSGESVLGGNS